METQTVNTRRTPININSNMEESVSEDSGSGSCYVSSKYKPYWRGRIHRLAFYATIGLYLLVLGMTRVNKFYLSVYFASQLVLYGVSSTYHLTNWKSREAEALFRKLDHSSIFLLISGTQTCVFMSINELYQDRHLPMAWPVLFTYIVAAVGILKVFLLAALPRYVNVSYYIFHGVSAALFIPLECFVTEYGLSLLCLMGGMAYIVGGTIYGARRPDPWPKMFGYHEVFHSLTVLGNLCFLLTVVWADRKQAIINAASSIK